ncbi:MAG TPA: HupV protein [bacterium]|nr:HupV protein [bacterium]
MKERTFAISPMPRVEGDLEARVHVRQNRVTEAWIAGVMFRGFEKLLIGRDPMDALVFAPRICGICSIGQSTAASDMLGRFYGVGMPENAYWVRNTVLGAEIIMNHQTHFYLLFAVDLTHPSLKGRPGYEEMCRRFHSLEGEAYLDVLKNRKTILEIMGLLAGKWPNSLAFQPGGVTRPITRSDRLRMLGVWRSVREFIEKRVLGGSLERWLEVSSLSDMDRWLGEASHADGDLGLFIRYGREWGLDTLGKGQSRFLSYGAFPRPDGSSLYKSGFSDTQSVASLEPGSITEDVSHSWFLESHSLHPYEAKTASDVHKEGAYSWAKAPRYQGYVTEVGPIARLIVQQDPLALDLVKELGNTVYTRIVLRFHDLMIILSAMETWIRSMDPEAPFYNKHKPRSEGEAFGFSEVSRGALGHWMQVKNGIIVNYQVISPSTWNFSPRGFKGKPGPVEQALTGTPVTDEQDLIEVKQIIRSFDPCLFCAVHSGGIS